MIVLRSGQMHIQEVGDPVTPLNAIWCGTINRMLPLPQLGHLYLVCPLGDLLISCAGTIVDGDHYVLLTHPATERPTILHALKFDNTDARVLVLMFSPDFIREMADFLSIPGDLGMLLHGVPLSQGDVVSRMLHQLAAAMDRSDDVEELYLEVVGVILRLLRLRHEALRSLAGHKQDTIHDLLPRLMRARQFIEAHFGESIKTRTVADHVALSEYHFARLFKTAFDITVHQYVLRLRLAEARHLLEATDMRVTDVALAVGYNSLSAFIHAFGRQVGMTPSEYQVFYQK